MALKVEELDNGVVVRQVTDDPRLKCNIYCERPYCTADSGSFLYARQVNGTHPRISISDDRAEWDYILCEFGTWQERVVGRGYLSGCVSYDGSFYYDRSTASDTREVVRLDLATAREEVIFSLPENIGSMGHPTVSRDGRYMAYGVDISYDPQMFGVELLDTRTGERRVLCEDPYICNTHAQFEPAEGREVLIQHNRGCEYAPDGTRLKLLGEEGCTIFLIDLDGKITPLPVGPPHTTTLTGHQAWIGETQEIIMTVKPTGDFIPERGNILCIRAGGEYRQIGIGRDMAHIGSTPCGRYFHADGIETQEIIVGSPATGRTVLVCHSRTTFFDSGFDQCSHPHAYLSPDFRWMVFNSDRTGRPEIYVASVPEDLLAGLDD